MNELTSGPYVSKHTIENVLACSSLWSGPFHRPISLLPADGSEVFHMKR